MESNVAVKNPFGTSAPATQTGVVAIEQQRAIAETQAAIIVAKGTPRDRVWCMDRILEDFALPALAEEATYEFSRGGEKVTGPSIRALEAIAGRWGNMQTGVRELTRHDGISECEAYAWDVESNFKDSKVFQVKHWRDTKQGGHALRDERDIYELIANMGARRKRACMEAVIPKDVVEAAMRQCDVTLRTKLEIDDDYIRRLLEAFGAFGVSREMIEKRIQRRLDTESLTPAAALRLRRIFNSLKDGMTTARDWFEVDEAAKSEAPKTGTAALKEHLAKTKPVEVEPDTTLAIPGAGDAPATSERAEPLPVTAAGLLDTISAAQAMPDSLVGLLRLDDVEATYGSLADAKDRRKIKQALDEVRAEIQNRK